MTRFFPIESDRVSLSVTEIGGHLSDVTFALPDGRSVRPMHVAPWAEEALAEDTPPILKMLRGDFFCAPFSVNDLLPEETRGHGRPANGHWRPTGGSAHSFDAELDGTVSGATVTKHVALRPGEAMVYQRHVMTGGSGRLPFGQHAMLKAETPLLLGFAPWKLAMTPPDPVETPPAGHSMLAPNQRIADLARAARADGGTVDLTVFPAADGFDDIWMLASDPAPDFAWAAATSPAGGWVWFALKDQRVLPETLLWLSNGGRHYPPWSGRHRRVIGIEDVCSYFHLGHQAALRDNPFSEAGFATAATLSPATPLVVSYAFGLAPAPPGFGRVTAITRAAGGVTLADAAGRTTFAACDVGFVTGDG